MENEEIVFIILLTTSGTLFVLVVLLIILGLAGKKVNKEKFLRQKMALDHQKSALKYTIQGQEKERQRLSTELHDSIASKLNMIHLKMNTLGEEFQEKKMLKSMLSDTIEETRRISYELMPVTLEKFGLITAFHDISDANSNASIGISFETNLERENIPNEYAIHLYRIVQELIHNSLKYANCSHISFSLKTIDGFLLLAYADNGVGRLEDLSFGKGLGLRNIKGRMTLLNGSMSVTNTNPGLQFKFKMKTSII